MSDLVRGTDGLRRCGWGASSDEYVRYHDQEWGRPVVDDDRLFEKLSLEGFQAGLAWITILRKREAFRAAFAGFHVDAVAQFDEGDVDRLLADAGIVRHRGKITAAIGNARVVQQIRAEEGSLAAFLWSFAPRERRRAPRAMAEVPAQTAASADLARELRRRGARFVGPTTVYALMQAMGMVNDHLAGCHVRAQVEAARRATLTSLR